MYKKCKKNWLYSEEDSFERVPATNACMLNVHEFDGILSTYNFLKTVDPYIFYARWIL